MACLFIYFKASLVALSFSPLSPQRIEYRTGVQLYLTILWFQNYLIKNLKSIYNSLKQKKSIFIGSKDGLQSWRTVKEGSSVESGLWSNSRTWKQYHDIASSGQSGRGVNLYRFWYCIPLFQGSNSREFPISPGLQKCVHHPPTPTPTFCFSCSKDSYGEILIVVYNLFQVMSHR